MDLNQQNSSKRKLQIVCLKDIIKPFCLFILLEHQGSPYHEKGYSRQALASTSAEQKKILVEYEML